MKSLLLSVLLCASTLPCLGSPPGPAPLHPTALRYAFDLHDLSRIHVTLDLPTRSSGSEILHLPSQWAGQTELFRAVSDLRTITPGATLTSTANPAHWLLRTTRSGPVTVSWDLAQDWSGPLRHPLEHRAILTPTLFEFTGENGLVAPTLQADDPVDLLLDFEHLPPADNLATSFGAQAHQHYTGPWSGVQNALFAGGELTTRIIDVQGSPVLLAMHGQWSFSGESIAPTIQKILSAERQLWRDSAPINTAIVIAPYEDPFSGGSGISFTNAFNLFLTDRQTFSADAASLLAHEAFHHWNPGGLGTVLDPAGLTWFTEGFTTYYQDLILKRAHIISEPTYLTRVNATIRDYLLAPHPTPPAVDLVAAEPGSEPVAAAGRITTRLAYQEPYLRGALIALWLDTEIARQTAGRQSLSDLMLALHDGRAQPLSTNRILLTAGRFVDRPTVARLRTLALDSSAPVDILVGDLDRCTTLTQEPAWTFDLGFDPASLHPGSTIRGVNQSSEAWRAGLRDGQKLAGYSLWTGNPDREVTVTLLHPGGTRERLTYLPRGQQIRIPQAQPVPGCRD